MAVPISAMMTEAAYGLINPMLPHRYCASYPRVFYGLAYAITPESELLLLGSSTISRIEIVVADRQRSLADLMPHGKVCLDCLGTIYSGD